jgi:hypothetical protein
MRRRYELLEVLFTVTPGSWRRGFTVLAVVLFAPLLLILIAHTLARLFVLVEPALSMIGALVVIYALWRYVLGRRY